MTIEFGTFYFTGWTPSYDQWSRSGINRPYLFPFFEVEVKGSHV